jgi:hypothetical protein
MPGDHNLRLALAGVLYIKDFCFKKNLREALKRLCDIRLAPEDTQLERCV